MPRRAKKSRLLRYGYWKYADPAPAIRRLLEKKEELLEEFDGMYEDYTSHSDFVTWAKENEVPARVRELVALAAPSGDYADLFGEVEVASGSGPDVGSMTGWSPILLARRRDDMITYRIVGEDGIKPGDSEGPLDEDEVYEFVAGDASYSSQDAREDALESYEPEGPTLEDELEAIGHWGRSASFSSAFYDLQGRWDAYVESVKESAREEFKERAKEE
jgi:hypothetical protein